MVVKTLGRHVNVKNFVLSYAFILGVVVSIVMAWACFHFVFDKANADEQAVANNDLQVVDEDSQSLLSDEIVLDNNKGGDNQDVDFSVSDPNTHDVPVNLSWGSTGSPYNQEWILKICETKTKWFDADKEAPPTFTVDWANKSDSPNEENKGIVKIWFSYDRQGDNPVDSTYVTETDHTAKITTHKDKEGNWIKQYYVNMITQYVHIYTNCKSSNGYVINPINFDSRATRRNNPYNSSTGAFWTEDKNPTAFSYSGYIFKGWYSSLKSDYVEAEDKEVLLTTDQELKATDLDKICYDVDGQKYLSSGKGVSEGGDGHWSYDYNGDESPKIYYEMYTNVHLWAKFVKDPNPPLTYRCTLYCADRYKPIKEVQDDNTVMGTVKFDGDGSASEEYVETTFTDISDMKDPIATSKDPAKYKFTGWYSDEAYSNLVSEDSTFTPTIDLWGNESNLKLYAKFDYIFEGNQTIWYQAGNGNMVFKNDWDVKREKETLTNRSEVQGCTATIFPAKSRDYEFGYWAKDKLGIKVFSYEETLTPDMIKNDPDGAHVYYYFDKSCGGGCFDENSIVFDDIHAQAEVVGEGPNELPFEYAHENYFTIEKDTDGIFTITSYGTDETRTTPLGTFQAKMNSQNYLLDGFHIGTSGVRINIEEGESQDFTLNCRQTRNEKFAQIGVITSMKIPVISDDKTGSKGVIKNAKGEEFTDGYVKLGDIWGDVDSRFSQLDDKTVFVPRIVNVLADNTLVFYDASNKFYDLTEDNWTLKPEANEGSEFLGWEILGDGYLPEYGLIYSTDVTVVAHWSVNECVVRVQSASEDGAVYPSEPITVEAGTPYTINYNILNIEDKYFAAIPFDESKYEFEKWTVTADANTSNGTIEGTIDGNTLFTASFAEKKVGPGPDPDPTPTPTPTPINYNAGGTGSDATVQTGDNASVAFATLSILCALCVGVSFLSRKRTLNK